MMNTRVILLLLILSVLIVLLAPSVRAQTGIIVQNADATQQMSASMDSNLATLLPQVPPHVILDYANAARQTQVVAPPSELQALLDQVSAHLIVEYANAAREIPVTPPAAELQGLFSRVAGRIILQYANTSRQVTLAYPRALIGDTVAPQIRDVRTQSVAGGVKITWTTDEFATSEVRYGTAPGIYSQTASDPLYEKAHSLTLTGLTADQTYYFVVLGADRSGNPAQSGEYQVQVQTKTYLPLIRRR